MPSSFSKFLRSGRINFEPYGIAPIALIFKRHDEEIRYRSSVLRQTVTHTRFALTFALILIASFAAVDPFIYVDAYSLKYTYIVRSIIFAVTLLYLLTTFRKKYPIYHQRWGTCLVTIVGVSWLLITYETNTVVVIYTFPALIVTSIYSLFFCGLFFRFGFISTCIFGSAYFLAIWSADIPIVIAIGISVQIVVIFLLLAMAAYQKELISRQLFVSERRERETLARQHEIDKSHLDWLRDLARFLRHEVRQPVAQINSSIELIQINSNSSDRLMPYITTASESIRHVWNLIERASRATDAEAFVRQARPQSIDLADLLSEVVQGYRQTHSGIKFRLGELARIRVIADPTLVREAIGNLLANAASFVNEEGTVEVTLEQSGDYATIRVRNEGPLLCDDPELLFGPFVSTRSGPSTEHQGLGLYLVRLIAERYGGSALLSNLKDESGVEASISLPL
jgi:signal transduction histidine kinase